MSKSEKNAINLPESLNEVDVIVNCCARCGKDHRVSFVKFKDGAVDPENKCLTHWGMCPTLKEPILMKILPDVE